MFFFDPEVLNKEQKRAVLEENSVLLIACPGSGKTRCLTYKLAYEISQLENSKQFIIAITYTNTAADEIKERIELFGIKTSQLWIGTIHKFCLDWILRPYSSYIENLKFGFSLINEFESEKIISNLCKDLNTGITYYDCKYYASLTGCRISSLDTHKHPKIKIVLEKYFEGLKEKRQIDYELILHYSYQILKRKPIIKETLSKIFPLILIDEYQDTKEIQYHIVFSILNSGKGKSRLFIVGDPNQSIFQSLGGYPMEQNEMEKILEFELKRKSLSTNYRSSSKVLDYFYNYKTIETSMISEGLHKHYNSKITFNNEISVNDLSDEIKKLLLVNINDYLIDPNEICIAAPQWIPLAAITRDLMVKMPELNFNGPGMAPFARDYHNFWYKISRILLTDPSPELYIKRLMWAKEILSDLAQLGVVNRLENPKTILKFFNSISSDKVEGLEFLKEGFESFSNFLSKNIKEVEVLNNHYISFFESAKAKIEKLKNKGIESIDTLENFKKVFKQKEGITISTIHGIKGCEFDTVIGFGLLMDWLPHFNDQNGEVNSKKMLYVLGSRARKNLHLISERGRKVNYFNPGGLEPTSHLLEIFYEYDFI